MLSFLLLCLASGANAQDLFLSSGTPQALPPTCGGNYSLGPAPVYPSPQSGQEGPGTGAWQKVDPPAVGLKKAQLDQALHFINANVKKRQCFLLIKDGKLAYEWYNPDAKDPPKYPFGKNWKNNMENKPHRGYSMTKTVGGFLLLLAATEDGLDLDADITKQYGVKSPKPYGVTLRMMMSQVIGGSNRPGQEWRYDELGDMWMHLFPEILEKATGHRPSYYYNRLHTRLGLSKSFTWPKVDTEFYEGAAGSCRDWARFGQLINNKGMWGGKPLIAAKYIMQMQQPVKYSPMNEYANPCYGLLIWVNSDKAKVPGCCWEASRLPPPHCGKDTFLNGGVHDLTLNIGLYGQVAMTLPSKNVVVVGFGNDLRPIEPARIGYYPAVCKILGLPCSNPPRVPETKCGEKIECTGVAAQCYTGGNWAHSEPVDGKEKCLKCFQERLILNLQKFPTAGEMVNGSCPTKTKDEAFAFMNCYCGVTGVNSNPWAPWPKSLPKLLNPRPIVPSPCPHPYPPPPPPPQPPLCLLPPKCIKGLQALASSSCFPPKMNHGSHCYKGIRIHRETLMGKYGCPVLLDQSQPILASKAFCWCGVPPPKKTSYAALTNGEEEEHGRLDEDVLLGEGETKGMAKPEDEDSSALLSSRALSAASFERARDAPVPKPDRVTCGWDGTRPSALDRACHNIHEGKVLKHDGEKKVSDAMKYCAQQCLEEDQQPCHCGTIDKCLGPRLGTGPKCTRCFTIMVRCLTTVCVEECACGDHDQCKKCGDTKKTKFKGHGYRTCSYHFRACAGFWPKASLLRNESLTSYFTV
jgi:CubicO group peptidase (beta-lactamase class C family)